MTDATERPGHKKELPHLNPGTLLLQDDDHQRICPGWDDGGGDGSGFRMSGPAGDCAAVDAAWPAWSVFLLRYHHHRFQPDSLAVMRHQKAGVASLQAQKRMRGTAMLKIHCSSTSSASWLSFRCGPNAFCHHHDGSCSSCACGTLQKNSSCSCPCTYQSCSRSGPVAPGRSEDSFSVWSHLEYRDTNDFSKTGHRQTRSN